MNESVQKFVTLSNEYCLWVEGDAKSSEEELRLANHYLVNLYSAILEVKAKDGGEDVDFVELTHEDWKRAYDRFASFMFKYYSVSFSPTKLEEGPVTGDIADDLADIYRDLKNGLWLYDNGFKVEAVWEWKESFKTHWGRHVVSALHALYCYVSDECMEL